MHRQTRNLHPQVASLGELHQALRVGFEPSKIVFDSPCKTGAELVFAMEAGEQLLV